MSRCTSLKFRFQRRSSTSHSEVGRLYCPYYVVCFCAYHAVRDVSFTTAYMNMSAERHRATSASRRTLVLSSRVMCEPPFNGRQITLGWAGDICRSGTRSRLQPTQTSETTVRHTSRPPSGRREGRRLGRARVVSWLRDVWRRDSTHSRPATRLAPCMDSHRPAPLLLVVQATRRTQTCKFMLVHNIYIERLQNKYTTRKK